SPVAGAGSLSVGTVLLQSLTSILSLTDNGDITSDGAVTLTAAGGIQSASEVTTSADDVTMTSALTLTGTVTIDTGSNAGSITFNQTVNGSQDLTLNAGLGNITFNQSVGQTNRLKLLKIVSTADATFAATASAEAFLQQAGSGTTTFAGPLHTSKLAGINITGTNLNVFTGITTIGGGTVTILLSGSSPSGVAVFNNNAQINSDGAVSITASTSMTTGGGITTTNDAITIDATVFLTNSVVIDSGSVGAPVLYTKTIDCLPANTHALTINAGISGTITVQGSVGKTTALRSLTLENSNGVQFGTIDADWLVASDYVRVQYAQNNANVVFNGAMVTDSFNALTGPYSVNLAGHESVIGTADFQNIQQAIFGNASTDVLLFLSALTVLTP
ncbi:MAG: hypothetical protein ACK57O_09900, partial [Planctomyces sp.]